MSLADPLISLCKMQHQAWCRLIAGKIWAQNVCETAVVHPRRNANAPKRFGDWVFSVSLDDKVVFV